MKSKIQLALVILMLFVSLNSKEMIIENNYGSEMLDCSMNSSNSLSIDFSLKSYEMEDVQRDGLQLKEISITNEGITLEKGLPELPTITRLIGIENEGNPYVNLISYEKEIIENITVFPNQAIEIDGTNNFEMNIEFYNNGEVYPKEIVRIGRPAILRNYRVASLIIYPFQYDPVKKELTIYSNIDFEILYNFEEETINPKQRDIPPTKAFESIYSSSILNYDLVNNNRSGEYQKPCLLIIRRVAIEQSYLLDFIDWKHRKGFDVVSITTEEENFNGSSSAEIINYIQGAYNTWENPPVYICIIGEGRNNNIQDIEPHHCTSSCGHGYSSDQIYGMVDGDDLLPDIMIGRLPFLNLFELQTVVNRVLVYEKTPYMNEDWIEDILLLSDPRYCTTGAYIHSKVTTNEYINSIIPNENLNYNIDFRIEENPNTSQIISKINSGVSFYNFLGDIQFGGMNNSTIPTLNNSSMLPFISAITCGTGMFPDDSGGLTYGAARRMVKLGNPSVFAGAIGFIGSSLNYTHTIYNNHFSSGISSGLFNDGVYTFGGALVKGQLALYNAFFDQAFIEDEYRTEVDAEHTMRWNHLWGDPTVELWTDVPMELIVDYPSTKTLGDNYVEISVTNSNSEPLDNVLVCLLKGEDEIFEAYYTDENGYALIPYSTSTIGEVLVTATKHNYIPHLGSFDIESGEFSANYSNLIIDDDNSGNSNGNGDGLANPGEQLELDIILKNFGNTLAQNITAEISSENPNINIINGSASYGNIAPSETASPDQDFVVSIDLNCPNENINIDILIQDDNNHIYNGIIVLPITGYNAEFVEINGDIFPNGFPYPITISLINTGEITTPDFYTKLIGNNEDLTIVDEYGYYNPIESGGTGVTSDYYTITAGSSVIPGAIFNLTLEIYVDSNYQTLFKSLNIPLVVGTPTVNDPLGPDTYGYLCFDDGDIGYDDAPIYDWIEINEIGKPLNDLNQIPGEYDLGAFNQAIELPFDFKFYGIEYDDMLTVSSAGWISFGVQEEEAFYNSPLPGPLGPSPMIAAFWDELDYIDDISNASYYYDYVYHKFIIEWSNFDNSGSGEEETFQVILFDPAYYPTLSSDGLIKMQYKAINNTNQCACFSSIGLEDHTQSVGLQYTYYNNYPVAAKELENEMAIQFTTGKNRQQGALNIPAGQTVELDHLYIENGLINEVYGTLIINDGLQINSNSTLRIYGSLILENSNLFVLESSQVELYGTLDLRDGSAVEFIEDSSFLVEAGATILGNTPRTYPSETEYIPGDRIIVQDGSYLSINGDPEDRVTITSSNPPTCWEGITFKNLVNDESYFENCDFSYIDKLYFSDDDADMQVEMINCNFTNSGQIVVKELASYDLKGENRFRCDISQNTATPLVTFGTVITIDYCDFNNNNGHGLAMYYPSSGDESENELPRGKPRSIK